MKKTLRNPLITSLLAAIFISLAWFSGVFFWALFVGFGLFIHSANCLIEEKAKGIKYFGVLYVGFWLWNFLCTWWIFHATLGGMIMAVFANAALMTIPFFIYRFFKRKSTLNFAFISLVITWLTYEFIHHNWSLSWPWLTLGNALARVYPLIQWYEFTGTAGGSLWILILAIVCLKWAYLKDNKLIMNGLILFFAPIILSLGLFFYTSKQVKENQKFSEVCVVQPNINTYTQKDGDGELFIPYDEQIAICLNLAKQKLTPNTEFLVLPETAINGSIRESFFKETAQYQLIKEFLKSYPKLTIVAGLDSYDLCPDQKNPTQYASESPYVGFYEPYNAAVVMTTDTTMIYHKNKFVPGAEQVPFPFLMKPIELILGGVGFGHFFGQENQISYQGKSGVKVAPSICYESIFGEHIAEFVQNDAQLLFIITNDDWWHDTEGHRHHFEYARLRSIETRMAIARSANTGFSGFIDACGRDSQKTNYRQEACLLEKIHLPLKGETLYVKLGDYVGRIASFLSVIALVFMVYLKIIKKK
jgi:apolipoprotein N-acyltransferase